MIKNWGEVNGKAFAGINGLYIHRIFVQQRIRDIGVGVGVKGVVGRGEVDTVIRGCCM